MTKMCRLKVVPERKKWLAGHPSERSKNGFAPSASYFYIIFFNLDVGGRTEHFL